MYKSIFAFLFALLLSGSALATDITVGASTVSGFNRNDIGSDITVSAITATNGSPTLSCSSCFPSSVVGLPGWRITINGNAYTALSVPSRSSVTLTSNFTDPTTTYSGTLHKFIQLRVWVSGQAFTPSGETVPIPQGSGTGNVYKRVAASVVNDGIDNVLYLPEFELPATTNGTPATSRWSAGLYLQSGAFVQSFPGCIDSWRLDATTDPTSWSGICSYNVPPPLTPPDTISFYTKNEINGFLPSCSVNQLVYFASTGRPQTCLTLGTGLSISGGVLSPSVSGGIYTTIQEEGTDLTQRNKMNFIGSGLTAADNGLTLVTDITVDSDLNALASNSTNGLWARTGTGTGAARTLQQPAAGITISNPAGTAGDPALALANDLAALEGLGSTGIAVRSATDTWVQRQVTQPAEGISITNPAGIAGNITLALANDLAALEGLGSTGIAVRSATDTWVQRQLTAPVAGITITNPAGIAGNITFALADDLAGVEAVSGTGIAVRAAAGVWTARTLQQPAAGISITNADGVAGDPTFSLANDLAGLEGLATNGIAARTATSTWTTRTITGTTNQVSVANGDGVSANPTLSLPTDVKLGTDGGSPAAGTIRGPDATGTNTAGADFYVAGGAGTGTGAPGLASLKYPQITASGSTLQTLTSTSYPIVSDAFNQYTDGTAVQNTVTETTIVGSGDGSLTIAAGAFRVGRVYILIASGPVTTTGTPTLNLRAYVGGTVVANSGAVTMANNTSGRWTMIIPFMVRAVGASGSIAINTLCFDYDDANGGTVRRVHAAGAGTVDTTTSQTLGVTAQWGTASASNSVRADWISVLVTR